MHCVRTRGRLEYMCIVLSAIEPSRFSWAESVSWDKSRLSTLRVQERGQTGSVIDTLKLHLLHGMILPDVLHTQELSYTY